MHAQWVYRSEGWRVHQGIKGLTPTTNHSRCSFAVCPNPYLENCCSRDHSLCSVLILTTLFNSIVQQNEKPDYITYRVIQNYCTLHTNCKSFRRGISKDPVFTQLGHLFSGNTWPEKQVNKWITRERTREKQENNFVDWTVRLTITILWFNYHSFKKPFLFKVRDVILNTNKELQVFLTHKKT